MKFIIGKKIAMSQLWQGDKVVAVTKVLAGPCSVVQIKKSAKDGYEAVQLGFGERKEKNIKKPQRGHLNKLKVTAGGSQPKADQPLAGAAIFGGKINLKYLREFRVEANDLKIGDTIDVTTFVAGDIIQVSGISKGKGFAGNVKRHYFHGHNSTHGTKDQVRTSGSIGAGGPQHVFKGARMPGRMGNAQITTKNLKIVEVDKENNILYISGSVPGARNGLVLVSGGGELKIATPPTVEDSSLAQTGKQTPENNEKKEAIGQPAEKIKAKEKAKAEVKEQKPEPKIEK